MSDETPESAVEREAIGAATTQIEYGGHTYEIVADPDDLPLAVMKAFEDGRRIGAIEQILGPVQFEQFLARSKRRDEQPFWDVLSTAFGFKNAGESGAS